MDWKFGNCFTPHWLTLFHSLEKSRRIRANPRAFKFPFQTLDFMAFLFWPGWRFRGNLKKPKNQKKKLLCVLEAQSYYFVSSSMSSDPSDKLASQTQVQECQRGLFNSNLLLGLLNSNFDFWSFPKELGQIELIKFSRLLWFPSSCTDLAPVILKFWAFIFVKKIG